MPTIDMQSPCLESPCDIFLSAGHVKIIVFRDNFGFFDLGGLHMNWQEFEERDPELAASGQERLGRHGLVMMATLWKNG